MCASRDSPFLCAATPIDAVTRTRRAARIDEREAPQAGSLDVRGHDADDKRSELLVRLGERALALMHRREDPEASEVIEQRNAEQRAEGRALPGPRDEPRIALGRIHAQRLAAGPGRQHQVEEDQAQAERRRLIAACVT